MRRLVLLPALLAILVGAPPALAWTWPVDGPVLQPFSLGGDPYATGQHRGIDVGSAEGVPVRAPAAGTVTFAGTVPGGGRTVTIETADGLAVTLLHLGMVVVAEGDAVVEGAEVGVVGWSGDPEHTVPSVHLGVRVATQAHGYLDPLTLLPGAEPTEPTTPAGHAAEAEPDEPTLTPAVTPESEEAPGFAVEVATLPSQPEEAGAALEPLPQALQQAELAEPADATVAPIGPLVVVSAGSSTPADESAAPAEAATPEPTGQARPHTASATAGGEPSSPAAPSAADPSSLAEPSVLAPASATAASRPEGQSGRRPEGQEGRRPEGQDGRRRGRAETRERVARLHRVRAGRRAELAVHRPVAAARGGAGSIEAESHGLARDARERALSARPESGSSTGTWLWRAVLPSVLAALALVALVRRNGRGGPGTENRELPPSGPTLDATPRPEPDIAVVAAAGPLRRDPRLRMSRPGRRLERGGPGGPVKRPVLGVRGRRASV